MSGQILKNVSRGSFYLAAEQFAALLAGVAYSIIVVRWLGPNSYGLLSLGLAIVGMATMGTGNFELFLERFAAEYETRGMMNALQRAHLLTLAMKCVLGVLVGTALVAGSAWIAQHYQVTLLGRILQILGLLVVFEGFTVTGRAVLFGLQRFGWIAAVSILAHAFKIAVVALLWWKAKGLLFLSVALVAIGGLQAIALTLLAVVLVRKGRAAVADPSGPAVRALAEAEESTTPLPSEPLPQAGSLAAAILRYSTPLYGARAAYVAGQNLSRIVLGRFVSPELLGYYSFALTVIERFATFLYALPFSVLPSLTQLVARADLSRFSRLADKSFRLVTTFSCALATALVLGAEPLTRLVGGPAYAPAVPVLRILAVVLWLRTAQEPLTMAFYARRQTGRVLGIAVTRLAIEIAAILALLPLFSIRGAAWAAVAAAAFGVAAGLALLARDLGPSHRWAVMFKTAALVGISAVAAHALRSITGPVWLPAVLTLFVWVPFFLVAMFIADLVTEDDLSLAAGVDIRTPWARGLRDRLVAAGLRFSRAVGARRPGALATVEGSSS